MGRKRVFVVFVFPVIFSIVFGSAVLANVLQEYDRELNLWPMSFENSHKSSIEIIGLSKQYSVSEPIEIQVRVNDSSFDCGDLYVTIYPSGKSNAVTQGRFFEQCFENENNLLPIGDKFSKIVDSSGSYDIVAELVSVELNTISEQGTFIVR